jgi:hypothetical protein
MVHGALHWVPRMFQIWACRQFMNIAPTSGNRPWEQDLCPLCPSCGQARETCSHILLCNHMGQVEALMHSINLLEHWLVEVDTDPDLCDCIVAYAQGRGGITMTKICNRMDHRYRKVAEEQDAIGWRRFMEGMICRTGLAESKQHSKRSSCRWLLKPSKTWDGRVYWKRSNIWQR